MISKSGKTFLCLIISIFILSVSNQVMAQEVLNNDQVQLLEQEELVSNISLETLELKIDEGKYVGREYKLSNTGVSINEALYKYVIKDYTTGKWSILHDYSETNEFTWKPTREGKYLIQSLVRSKNSIEKYDVYTEKVIEVKEEPIAKIAKVNIDVDEKSELTYTISSTASSSNEVLYKYVAKNYATGKWTILQDYNETNSITWKPTSAGKYLIEAQVRDKESTRRYDTYIGKEIEIKGAVVNQFKINKGNYIGREYNLSTTCSSINGTLYKYVIKDYTTGKWSILQDYSETNEFTWEPTSAGKYLIQSLVRDKYSTEKYDTYTEKVVEVKEEPIAKITALKILEGGYPRLSYTMFPIANSTNEVLYKYKLYDHQTEEWTILQDYSETNEFTWKPTSTGKYLVQVQVRDKDSIKKHDTYIEKEIEVNDAVLSEFKIDEGKYVGRNYNLSSIGGSINGVLFKYVIKDCSTGEWTILKDYSETNDITWKPTKAGTYRIQSQVLDKKSPGKYDAYIEKIIKVKEEPKAILANFKIDEGKYVGREYNLRSTASSSNKILYKYVIKDCATGKWTILKDYSSTNNYTWKPTKAGTYRIQAQVCDEDSLEKYDTYIEKIVTVKTTNLKNITIMLDPGHGGIDSGAYYSGTAERDLNLIIANKVANQLKHRGYNVVMSRTTNDSPLNNDIYDRAARANAVGADIYVSIHHNAIPSNSSVSGIETYYYISKSQYPPLPGNADSHNDPTRLSNSLKLANSIQNELIKATGANNRGIKRGSYVVLRETKMPAVLLELGFMSNPTELKRLKSDSYQNTLTNAIVRGINDYFSK